MAWHFLCIDLTARGDSDVRETQIRSRVGPQVSEVIVIDDSTTIFLVKPAAGMTDRQAEILATNSSAVPGACILVWYETWMRTDLEATYKSMVKTHGELKERLASMHTELLAQLLQGFQSSRHGRRGGGGSAPVA